VLSAPELDKPQYADTDGEGRYEFTALPPGRFTLAASKTGYVTLQFGQRRSFAAGRPIQLNDAQALDAIDIALPRAGVITGRVIDDTGEPIVGVNVSAMRRQFANGVRRLTGVGRPVETDDRGVYRLFGLAPGSYYVQTTSSFLSESLPFGSFYHPGTANPAEAGRIRVGTGQVQSGVDLLLRPTSLATLSGALVDAGRGAPLAGGTVRAHSVGSTWESTAGVVRPDASFSIAGVPPGDYALTASGRDPETGTELWGRLPLTVTGDDLDGLVVSATPGGRASGQITFEGGVVPPFRPAALNLFSDAARPGESSGGPVGTIRGDWTFELGRLHGARLIRLTRLPRGWVLKSVRLGGRDITDTGIVFTGTEDVAGIQIVLSDRPTTITGRVLDQRGDVVDDCAVVVFAEDPARWTWPSRFIATGRPDLDGRFTITGLPAGPYRIIALEYIDEDEAADPEFLATLRAAATRITLTDGESTAVELKVRNDVY